MLESANWTPAVSFGSATANWHMRTNKSDFSEFEVLYQGSVVSTVKWKLIGQHNAENALAVFAAASQIGVDPVRTASALAQFKSVKRRLELLANVGGISVYDDFAHHPTAIRVTLSALRASVGKQRIFAVFEPRSSTMKMGTHKDTLADSLIEADVVVALQPAGIHWDLQQALRALKPKYRIFADVDGIIEYLLAELRAGDQVLIMSNGGFGAIHTRLIQQLEARR